MAVAARVMMRVGPGKEARDVPSPLPLLLQLAHDTGRRLSAIPGAPGERLATNRGNTRAHPMAGRLRQGGAYLARAGYAQG